MRQPAVLRETGKNAYRCVTGPGKGCRGVSVNAVLLAEYVTGAVLDSLESPQVQEAVRAGADTGAPRRAELLEEIRRRRKSAPTPGATGPTTSSTGKTGWTSGGAPMSASPGRKEYDRLSGTATVLGDIPPRDMVHDAWEDWNTDRKRAAVKAVLNAVAVHPNEARSGGPNWRRELMLSYISRPDTVRLAVLALQGDGFIDRPQTCPDLHRQRRHRPLGTYSADA